ncbi:hypothetical protein [Paraburkholderia phytofirmans]|uniref:hypothetical protein n=1 Tax=Paraburkholderia phytofirmans TaxID=261302 RepID=UPI001313F9A1|nr:hypothetical protein [Paraburkholderia phytofirmans]
MVAVRIALHSSDLDAPHFDSPGVSISGEIFCAGWLPYDLVDIKVAKLKDD